MWKETPVERHERYLRDIVKSREQKNIRWRKNYDTNPEFRLNDLHARSLRHTYSKKGLNKKERSSKIRGCTKSEFRAYIKSLFMVGMTDDNRAEWDLDHIIPVSTATSEEEINKLYHYTNIRPLWWDLNLLKSDNENFVIPKNYKHTRYRTEENRLKFEKDILKAYEDAELNLHLNQCTS